MKKLNIIRFIILLIISIHVQHINIVISQDGAVTDPPTDTVTDSPSKAPTARPTPKPTTEFPKSYIFEYYS